jgi:hypothetical protein
MSLPSALAPLEDATIRQQRKSVAEGCDAPKSPPIIIYGRDADLDKKSHGNQTLLKLIRRNLIPYREAHYDVQASLLVKKIIQQIRDWRGRFVRFNKDRNVWKDIPSNEVIALVRGMFDEEVLTRRGNIDSAIQIYPPTQPAIQKRSPAQNAIRRFFPKDLTDKGMDKDQIEAYWHFTPVQRDKFRKLCQLSVCDVKDAVNLIEIPPWLDIAAAVKRANFRKLCKLHVYDVEDAVTLIEMPPWTHAAVVSPIAALSSETQQKENGGENKRRKKSRKTVGLVPARKDAKEAFLCESSGEKRIRTESCSWVDAPMLATQDSEESLLLRLTTDDDNTPLPFPESYIPQVPVPEIDINLYESPFLW